jgi:hypothetical protein
MRHPTATISLTEEEKKQLEQWTGEKQASSARWTAHESFCWQMMAG